jgi:putative membrane protein
MLPAGKSAIPRRGQRFFGKISAASAEVPMTDSPPPGSDGGGTEPGGTEPGGTEPGGTEPGGTEPDPRFTFANERTFLAWSRTALALVVAGLGVVQLLPPFPGVPWGRHVLGVPLIVFGAVVALAAYREWVISQRALRLGQPLARSVLPRLLAVVIAVMAVISAVVVLASALR